MPQPRIICTVTNDLSHDQRMQRICTTLSGAGYEVWLVGRLRRHSRPLPQQSYRQVRLPCWYERGKVFYVEYNLRLLFFLLRHRFTVVNAVDLDTLLAGYLAARLRARPCVYDAHEYFTETPEVVRRPRVQRAWEWLADTLVPRLSYAYTVGPALATVLMDRYGIQFHTVRNLPLSSAAAGDSPDTPPYVLLYQGMLNEGRGLETAIRAMLQLPDCHLWLAGAGDLQEALQQLVEELQLEARVRFLGLLPPADLPALTRRAWLGLNLLENRGLSYYYSLANKAADYIQAGLPSVQMDFPEYRHWQAEHRVFVLLPDLEVASLVAAVQRLIAQPAAYSQLRQNCLQAAPLLTWASEEETLLSLYRRATAEAGQ